MNIPLLFLLPPELLAKISFYCFKDFRSTCKLLKEVAFPWNVLAKTQANCLILGANLQSDWYIGNAYRVLYFACITGKLELVKFCRDSFKMTNEACDFNYGLAYACEYNQLEVAKLCKEYGAFNFYYSLSLACQCGNLELIKFCVSSYYEYLELYKLHNSRYNTVHGIHILYKNIDRLDLILFCYHCSPELANFCKNSSVNEFNYSISKFMYTTARYTKDVINSVMKYAHKGEHSELIQFCEKFNRDSAFTGANGSASSVNKNF